MSFVLLLIHCVGEAVGKLYVIFGASHWHIDLLEISVNDQLPIVQPVRAPGKYQWCMLAP